MKELPKELTDKILRVIEDARVSGKIRKGTNEATKSVERSEAKFVAIAADINPKEIVMHIPMLCEAKGIPYAWVPTKTELGAAAGLPVGTSAIAIANPGESAKALKTIIDQINTLNKPAKEEKPKAEPKKEAPKAEKKPEAKKEEPKEEKKEEPKEEPKAKAKDLAEETKPEVKEEEKAEAPAEDKAEQSPAEPADDGKKEEEPTAKEE